MSKTNTEQPTAVAWWVENDGDEQYLCYDTERGETVAVDITDASFGGEVRTDV